MGGMTITGAFSSGSNAVCTWVNGAGGGGGCTAAGGGINGFQLALSGSTFSNPFSLTNISGGNLLSLLFDGLPGNTVFDRTFGGVEGTGGSNLGSDAAGSTSTGSGSSATNKDGQATYINRIATLGNPSPVGDLFAQVSIVFINGGLTPGNTASMIIDTDNIGLRNGTPGSGVPEPSTFGMLGAGLAGLAWFRRSRR